MTRKQTSLERRIAAARAAELRATDAGHEMEREFYAAMVDELLDEMNEPRRLREQPRGTAKPE